MPAARRGELFLVVGGLATALVLGEAVAHLLRPGATPSSYPRVRLAGANGGPFNSLGYRDRERSKEKPTGVRRIVSLGDSFAWGWGILLDDTYARRVERMLTERRVQKETWEVVSLASPGLNSVQEAERLSAEGFAYCPDVVVLGYVLNDSDDQHAPEVKRTADWLRNADATPWAGWPVLRHSALVRLLATRIRATVDNRRRVEGRRATYAPGYPGWIAGQKALREMAGMCRERGVPLVILIFPDLGVPLDDRYPFTAIHAQVRTVAIAAGARVVDLLPSFRGLNSELLVVAGVDDTHPNEIAHRIAALALFDALREVLPPPGEGMPHSCSDGRPRAAARAAERRGSAESRKGV